MNNIPSHISEQIQEAICRPEGTFTFEYHSPYLFDKSKRGGTILEVSSRQHLFRLERDDGLNLHFYHSSPGSGTRVATIDLNKIVPAENVFMAFSWTPVQIMFHAGSRAEGAALASATCVESPRKFRIGKDGNVYRIGDPGVEVMGLSLYQGGQPVIQPTALDAWEETLNAIDILATGQSSKGYIYEVVVTNLTLVVLVTGFEAYTKKRFLGVGIRRDFT